MDARASIMIGSGSCRVIAEEVGILHRVQLIEDCEGAYHLRKISVDGGKILSSAPIYRDAGILAEAREYFPECLPFAALPVDAT